MTNNDGNSDWLTVASLAAITTQLLRLSIDMVKIASVPADGEIQSATDRVAHHGGGSQAVGRYGSIANPHATMNAVESNNGVDEEHHPLLDNRSVPDSDELWRVRRNCRVNTFLILDAMLLIIYSVARIMKWSEDIYPHNVLDSSIIVLMFEVFLLNRDREKKRYGGFVRFLHLWSALILWLVYFGLYIQNLIVSWSPVSLSSFYGAQILSRTSWQEAVILATATVHLILVIVDSCLAAVRSPQPGNESSTDVRPRLKARLSRKAIVTLLKPYFWPDATNTSAGWNRIRAMATWFCVVASKICTLVSPLFLGWASTALAHQDYEATIRFAVAYAAISWLGQTFRELQSLIYLKVAQAAYVELATTAFKHLHSLSLDWHLRKKMGVVLRSMTRGISACDTLMKYLFLWLLPALVECLVVCLIFATYFSYLPLAIAVFYSVFVYVVWTILMTLWRKKFRRELVQSDNEMEDRFVDSMMNFETVKFFTAEEYESSRFSEAVQNYQAGSVHVQSSLSILNISQQAIVKGCLAIALSLAAYGIRQRIDCCVQVIGCNAGVSDCCRSVSIKQCPGMQVGDFVAVLTYTLNLFAPLNFLGTVYNAVVMAIIDLTNMSELLAESPDVTDAPDAIELPRKNSSSGDDIAAEFDKVYFHYPSQPEGNGLRGLSFKMRRGTTTAIVGPTGAGKTTISRLLFRFYDVTGGAVKVNGVDVRSVTQQSLRHAIGVVPQAASLFNDTIKYNLLYGKRDATDEELRQAAVDSQIIDFIESLTDGWESLVGDRGLKLSGGEKQRAAICRCLLKNPEFVILDEATSALDSLTERSVQEALDRLGAHRTVLVIAHRLGTIRNADNIIVVKDGIAAEQGTHDELMARNGIYAEMWNTQLHMSSAASMSQNSLHANAK